MRRLILVLSLLVCSLDAVAAVTGHVVDDDGKPLAGVRVRAIALEPVEAQYARLASASPEPVPLSETQTNDAGAFSIDAKRQPVVTLLIDTPARTPVAEDVVDGEDAGTFLLRAAPVKKGRVTAGGKPVANALVIVNGAFLTRTSDAGEYSIPDPATWVNRIVVLHPSFAMAERSRGPRDPRESWGSLDMTLDAGVAARGRVVDAAGRPIANATLRNGLWPLGTSGQDGSFAIAHLPSTVKTLNARDASRAGSGSAGAETIVLRPAATVGGTVRSTKDDTPVAGARVSLRGDALPGFVPGAITDAKGNFVFDGIPAGIVQLGVSHPSFNGGMANGIAAPEGGRVDRALTATPLARVSGVVVDEAKKPVGGARIAVFGGPSSNFSAPDGSFSTRFLPFDRGALIEASKPAYASATHGPLRLEPGDVKTGVRIVLPRGTKFEFRLVDPQGVAVADEPVVIRRRVDPGERMMAMPVRCGQSTDPQSCRSDAEGKLIVNVAEATYDVQAGGVTTVERLLSAQTLTAAESPLTIELERGSTIEGRVVWSDGAPLTTPASVNDSNRGAGVQVIDGAFAMRNVRAGKNVLTVQTGPPSFITGEPVEVTAPATGVVLKLARPGRVEGRVVERDTHRAVPQFSVTAEPRTGMRRGPQTKSFTASDGKFILEDVPPGSVDVLVSAPGFVRSTTSAVEIEEGKATSVEVTLERAGTVAGRVTSGGRAVAGASISAGDGRERRRDAKQTDANGEYVLDTLPPGSQELTVRKQGYVARTISVSVAAGKETRGDVELSRGRELQGRVVDTAGRPIASAEVMFGAGAGRMNFDSRILSDADGSFRLEGLGDDPITVTARKSGYADGSVDVTPASGSVTVTLDRGGTISGRVIGLPAAELQGTEITAMPTSGRRSGRPIETFADASGAFTLAGVPDGDVLISAQQVRPPRRRVGAPAVKVTGGVAPFVELDFGAGFTIRGRVTRRGQPVTRGSVIFAPANPRERGLHALGEIDAAGAYELRVAEPGEYEVMVSLRDAAIGTTRMGKLDVRGETQHDIDVRGAAVRVRVVDSASGVALPDVRVMIVGERSGGTDRVTDSSGRVVFDFIGDGVYTLRASKQGYAADPREIRVQNGADVDVDLAVGRGEQVTLRLLDAATRRIAQDAFAAIVDSAGRTVADRPAATDPEGGLRYWLPPDNYTVRVMSRQYAPKTVPLVVPGTPVVEIELATRE